MKILSSIILTSVAVFITACDGMDNVSRPKTESRTMIIGGVPVHDRDYQLQFEPQPDVLQAKQSH